MTALSRTEAVGGPGGGAALAPPRIQKGRVGIIGLIIAEISLFGVFVVAYLFYIGKSLNGPYPKDVLDLPLVGTICLLSSSISVALGARALRQGHVRRSGAWLFVTVALGAIFLVATAKEWYGLIYQHGLTIGTNLFGTTFYPLVGLHATHVVVGLLMLSLCCVLAVTGTLRPTHGERVEIVSWYWHFVDGIWVVVFTVVYVIGR
jgi:cytochrome c oxidase subunit 3/cytochrome o ubiquinol oxidase subunit 3